jgi:hypothetical protein
MPEDKSTQTISLLREWNQAGIERRLYAALMRLSEKAVRGDQEAETQQHRLIQDYSSLRQDYVTNLEHMVKRYEDMHT